MEIHPQMAADAVEACAYNIVGAARDFKSLPTLDQFARLVGACAALATLMRGYVKPLSKQLARGRKR